jgi:Transposase DDE domain
MHKRRSGVLVKAADALVRGRRLTLMDLARSWPSAERVRAPLKRLDRPLSNAHVHEARESVYRAMARWLVRDKHPVIVVDWADLKADRNCQLLRAAIPVGGRTLTVLDMVFPDGQQGTPSAEHHFLQRLAQVLPRGVHPILVTDAGFRAPWFRAVEAMGWRWVGRLRHRTLVKPVAVNDSDPRRPKTGLARHGVVARGGKLYLALGGGSHAAGLNRAASSVNDSDPTRPLMLEYRILVQSRGSDTG